MAVPAAIYGRETWITRKDHETGIRTAEMKFLRVIAACTCTHQQCSTEKGEN